jgi:hypothetical protein
MPSVLYSPPRPQSIGEVLDSAFIIFKITLIKCLPLGLLAMVASQSQSIYDVATGRPLAAHNLTWYLFLLVGTLLSVVLSSAIILRQVAILDRQPTLLLGDLSRAFGRLPAMSVALFLGLLAVCAGLALLIVPGIYLALAFLFAGPAILLSGTGPVAALRQGLRLIRGNGLRAFTVFAVGLSVVLVFDMLMFTFVAVLLQFAGTGDVAVVTSYLPVVVICLGSITAPFGCALTLALYGDLQARKNAAVHSTPSVAPRTADEQAG